MQLPFRARPGGRVAVFFKWEPLASRRYVADRSRFTIGEWGTYNAVSCTFDIRWAWTIWLGASWPAYEPTNLRASNPQSRSANGPELRPGVHRDAQGEDCVSVPGALEKVHNYWSLQVLGKREDSECRGELLPFPVLSQPGKAWRHHANGGWPAAVFHETETGGGKSSWPLEDHYEPGSHATNPQTQSSSDDLLARALPSPHQWVSGSIRESNPWPFHARLLPASGDEHVTHWT